ENFGKGRVFIGGDAAHLFTPTGGLGYNTAIEDAVNLGWKLAAVIKNRASEKLLASYEAERRPLALRNTAYAKAFADSLGNYVPPPEIEDDSPAVVSDGSTPPPDTANVYVSTACPGGRPPHLWMPDGRSLYDLFGFEWTLLAFKPTEVSTPSSLKTLHLENTEARDLYGADFVLIRPDQIVAWRGNSAAQVNVVLGQICGVFPGAQGVAALS